MDRSFDSKNKRRDPAGKRRAILEAGLACFAAKGFEGTSVSHIADAAGVNKSSIAFHFGSKRGLWEECLLHRGEPMLRVMDRFIRGEVAVDDLLEARIELHRLHPDVGRLFAWASLEPTPIPEAIVGRKEGLVHQLGDSATSADCLRFLRVLAAVDGWFLFRNLYRKMVGDEILSPDAEARLLRAMRQEARER